MTSTVPSPTRARGGRGARPTPLAVTVAAWAAPVMVAGGFALVAVAPVAVAAIGSLLRVRDTAVRVSAALLAATYTVPLVIWLTRADPAPSLSQDLHPGFVGLVVAASVALIVGLRRAARR
ncbi:hypothetical protein [Streptomyces sp. NPDC088789]|uniref:hypothetical protein n=1 Tax=Streptomyces sp. NPDC088789 TaxID=3365899 RepID=UPI003802ED9A